MLGETNEHNCNDFFMSIKYSEELPFLCTWLYLITLLIWSMSLNEMNKLL